MTNTSAVAVVIPCYKQAHFLGDALRSCLAQEVPPAEIIVVDDGSPDDVAAAVAALGEPRIQLVRRPNGGISAARNTGLVASTSPFIVFLDADDTLRPCALSAGLACHAANPAAAFVWGGYQAMDGQGRPFGPPHVRRPRADTLLDLLVGNIVSAPCTVMYRSEPLLAAGGFDETLSPVADWDSYLRLAAAHPVASHDAIVARYRRYDTSMSTDHEYMLRGGLTMFEYHRPSAKAPRALVRAWRRGRARFVGRHLRKALLAALRGLGHGDIRPLLRAGGVPRYAWYVLPAQRPGFAVRAMNRQVLRPLAPPSSKEEGGRFGRIPAPAADPHCEVTP
jgi:glycosyltransferase involved in cell wall biosynthesis